MAQLTFFASTDMTQLQSFGGTVFQATATQYIVKDSYRTAIYQGNFTYQNNTQLSGGTLTGYTLYQNNALAEVMTGFSIAVSTAANDITNNNIGNILKTALTGDDVITGSSSNDVLSGGTGNDVFISGGGNDTIIGGGGIDTLKLAVGYRGVTYTNSIASGTVNTSQGTINISGIRDIAFIDGRVTFDQGDHAAQTLRLYQAALGRDSDQAGLAYWTAAFDKGASLTSLASGFLGSAEFKSRFSAASGSDNGAFVEQLYQNVLHRGSDASGKAYWTTALANGSQTRATVLTSFSESAENQGSSAIATASGLWVADPVAAQVARLYDTTFGRLPDTAGLDGWKTLIENGNESLAQVAANFVGSAEFQARYGSLIPKDFVNALYVNTLHRPADSEGLNYWVNAIGNGASRGDVVVNFSESAEHMTNTAANVMGNTPSTYGIKFAS